MLILHLEQNQQNEGAHNFCSCIRIRSNKQKKGHVWQQLEMIP